MARQGTGFRIQGSTEQIEEALRRLRHLFSIHSVSKLYDSRSDINREVKLCYVYAYTYEPDTLLNQIEALKTEVAELQEILGELELQYSRLQEELGQLPKPKKYDAVLLPTHPSAPDLAH